MVELYCDGCGTTRPFEQPPCREPHEPDCPEWLCTRCTTAFLIDPPLRERSRIVPRARRRLAPVAA